MSENKEEKTVGWDKAISGKKYITLEKDELKQITITDWKLVVVNKFGDDKVEFQSKVLIDAGLDVSDEEVVFNTVSNPIKSKLKVILEDKDPSSIVKIQIIKADKGSYSIKEMKSVEVDKFPPEELI